MKICPCCQKDFDDSNNERYCIRCSGYGQSPRRATREPHYAHSKKWHDDFGRGKYYIKHDHPRRSTDHSTATIQLQYNRQHGKCYYCGTKTDGVYHVDHVIPVSRGGTNDLSNLVITCPHCNESKNDRMPHEWPEGGKLL